MLREQQVGRPGPPAAWLGERPRQTTCVGVALREHLFSVAAQPDDQPRRHDIQLLVEEVQAVVDLVRMQFPVVDGVAVHHVRDEQFALHPAGDLQSPVDVGPAAAGERDPRLHALAAQALPNDGNWSAGRSVSRCRRGHPGLVHVRALSTRADPVGDELELSPSRICHHGGIVPPADDGNGQFAAMSQPSAAYHCVVRGFPRRGEPTVSPPYREGLRCGKRETQL